MGDEGKRAIGRCTVCPGSSDPQEKLFWYIFIRKVGLHRYTVTIFYVEYYSFTEQKKIRSHELDWINSSIQYFRSGHYFSGHTVHKRLKERRKEKILNVNRDMIV